MMSARLTPYELVFEEGDFESRIFPRIGSEAAAAEVEPFHRERFDFLSTAGDVVRELTPEDSPPEALDQYRALLYHAFHFWQEGKRLYVVEPGAARFLIETDPRLEGWTLRAPARSFYLQLPANLFWSSISPQMPPEPVDGFFVTVGGGKDVFGRPFDQMQALVVLGIRRARAGFSVIPVESELGPGIAPPWAGEGRPEGDFRNELPGGEIAGLYSILTTGEVLKLIGRILWHIDQVPASMSEVRAPDSRSDEKDPPPSRLGYVRVALTQSADDELHAE